MNFSFSSHSFQILLNISTIIQQSLRAIQDSSPRPLHFRRKNKMSEWKSGQRLRPLFHSYRVNQADDRKGWLEEVTDWNTLISKGSSIKDILFFGPFWTYLLTYIQFLGPFLTHIYSYLISVNLLTNLNFRYPLWTAPNDSLNLFHQCARPCKIVIFIVNCTQNRVEILSFGHLMIYNHDPKIFLHLSIV